MLTPSSGMASRLWMSSAVVLALCASGCSGSVTRTGKGFSASPKTATVLTGHQQAFVAQNAGRNDSVESTWSVEEGGGGDIDARGLYTAPATPGTFHVRAQSKADPAKTAQSIVTVVLATQVAVAISPQTVTVEANAQTAFSATVTGTQNTAVTWTVEEGSTGGTVTADGLYTAPGTGGVYHLTVTSQSDATRSDTATVKVNAPAGVTVTIAPKAASVLVGASRTFTALVTGASDTTVTFSVAEGAAGGTVDTSGLYTAPATEGTYHVVATSTADATRSDTATVLVIATLPVAVSISPTSLTMLVGGSTTFTATVTGNANTALTWSVTEGAGGAVTAGGVYTAPSTAGTYHVVATSVADATKSATATVTVEGPVAVSLSASPMSVDEASTYALTATVTGSSNKAVTWSVTEAMGGTVSDTGVYTAPVTVGTYHVVATSVADPTKSATATMPVVFAVYVTTEVATATFAGGDHTNFNATVHNATDLTLTWSVTEPSGGPIASNGAWDAPLVSGTFHIVATSVENPAKSGTVTVTVKGIPTTNLKARYSGNALLGTGVTLPADAAPVATWKDLSGNGNDLVQSTVAAQPSFKSFSQNARASVLFDGTSNFLATTKFAPTVPQPTTVVLVYKLAALSADCTLLDAPASALTDRNVLQALTSPQNALQMFATGLSGLTATVAPASFHQVIALFNGTSSELHLDKAKTATTFTNLGSAGMGGLQLGARQDGTAFCPAEVAELITYSRALTAAEVTEVEAYVSEKYLL